MDPGHPACGVAQYFVLAEPDVNWCEIAMEVEYG